MSNPIEKYLNETGQATILIKKTQVELIKSLINEKINDCDINIQHMRRQKKIKEEKNQLKRVEQYDNYIDKEIELRAHLITLKRSLK
jgi:hypothetical protein